MIVGKYMSGASKNKFIKHVVSKFGVLDLHSQMRIRPLAKYVIDRTNNFKNKNIIEIGCGSGINCFEVFFNSQPKSIIGFDLNNKAINKANELAEKFGILEKVKFYCQDATEFNFEQVGKADYILLIDFIEHINNPKEFLSSIQKLMHDKTTIIVSIPTHNYKKVFGEKFHHKAGHVRDGYNIDELTILFKNIGYRVMEHSYTTGIFGAIGCFMHYRLIFKIRYFNLIKSLVLYPFSLIDFINNKYVSSSLFVILKKDRNV